jgi:repressor LexA
MDKLQLEDTLETVYQFIRSYSLENGYPPSHREISVACYIGRSTVLRYLDKLEKRGRIIRTLSKARGIHLIENL